MWDQLIGIKPDLKILRGVKRRDVLGNGGEEL